MSSSHEDLRLSKQLANNQNNNSMSKRSTGTAAGESLFMKYLLGGKGQKRTGTNIYGGGEDRTEEDA